MLWPTDVFSIETLLLLLALVVAVRIYVHRRWTLLKKWNIPHDPPSFRNLGNMRVVLSDKFFTNELESKKKYGPVWGYYTMTSPRIVIHDPEILEQICVKDFSNFTDRFATNPELNGKEMRNALIYIGGEQWKRIRSTLTPALSTGKLREMSWIVDWCVGNSVKAFERRIESGDGSFSAKDFFNRLSLDIICSAAFSQNVHSQDDTKEEPTIFKQAKRFFKTGVLNIGALIIIALPFLSPIFLWIGGRQGHILYFRNLCKQFIMKREENVDKQKRVDLMQQMLDMRISEADLKAGAHKGLTPDELIGNSMVMLLGGYETTGTALSYFAYNLAMHPEIQSKLQQEIDEAFAGMEKVDFDTAHHLEYLDMCLNESLRLYSPATRTIRTAEREITISGLTIPRGCMVAIPVYAMMHDPDYWDKPMEYNPERMKNVSEIHPLVFMPFGAGPRKCIGARFAVMVLKLAFCNFLRHYTFVPTADTPKAPLQLVFDLTTQPKVNYSLRVVPRS